MSSMSLLLFGLFTRWIWETADCGLEYGVMLLVYCVPNALDISLQRLDVRGPGLGQLWPLLGDQGILPPARSCLNA